MTEPKRPNGNAEDAAARSQAQSEDTDLDAALKEFEDGSKPKPEPKGPYDTLKAVAPVIDYVRQEQQQKQNELAEKAVKGAVDSLLEAEETKGFSRKLAEGYLHARYAGDADFKKAFDEHHKHPVVWKRELEKARAEFLEEVRPYLGGELRKDVEAAAATVRGTSETRAKVSETPAADLFAMSPSEFRTHKQKLAATS